MTKSWRSVHLLALLALISCSSGPNRELQGAEVSCEDSSLRSGLEHIVGALRQGDQLGPFISEAVYGNPAGVIIFETAATGKQAAEDLSIENFPDLTLTTLDLRIDSENDIGNFVGEWLDPDGRKAIGKGALSCSQQAFAALAINWEDEALQQN